MAVAFLAGGAYRTASTPAQDWWRAVEYVKQHAGPNDIVLTGPNSEYEVYRVYAKAADVKAQSPLLIEDATRSQKHLDRADGLAVLLKMNRPVWFVTAAYGAHRSPQYWQLLRDNFEEVARINGQGDILIFKKR